MRGFFAAGDTIETKYRVLIVDDNRDTAKALSTLLELNGYVTLVVNDSTKAVQSVREFRPHFVLLDIAMPGISGHAIARLIRQQPELASVSLIAHSGNSDRENVAMSLEAGCDHHIGKPMSMADFRRVVAAEVEKREPGLEGFFVKRPPA